MYNCDVLGWRHNAGETALSKAAVVRMEEKWRFPPMEADFEIGVIHATPAVVSGYGYFTTLRTSRLLALDASTGKKLREIQRPPVWSGSAVSRGRVHVGAGNIVLPDVALIGPTQTNGTLFSYGLPGEDEVSRMGGGKE